MPSAWKWSSDGVIVQAKSDGLFLNIQRLKLWKWVLHVWKQSMSWLSKQKIAMLWLKRDMLHTGSELVKVLRSATEVCQTWLAAQACMLMNESMTSQRHAVWRRTKLGAALDTHTRVWHDGFTTCCFEQTKLWWVYLETSCMVAFQLRIRTYLLSAATSSCPQRTVTVSPSSRWQWGIQFTASHRSWCSFVTESCSLPPSCSWHNQVQEVYISVFLLTGIAELGKSRTMLEGETVFCNLCQTKIKERQVWTVLDQPSCDMKVHVTRCLDNKVEPCMGLLTMK